MKLEHSTGLVSEAEYIPSPNCDEREHCIEPEVVIIHCISLPPGDYENGAVHRFFQNNLDADEHPYYQGMAHLTVSSHFLISSSLKRLFNSLRLSLLSK